MEYIRGLYTPQMEKSELNQSSQPAQTMQELYQWIKTWEKYVSSEKRKNTNETDDTTRKRTR